MNQSKNIITLSPSQIIRIPDLACLSPDIRHLHSVSDMKDLYFRCYQKISLFELFNFVVKS